MNKNSQQGFTPLKKQIYKKTPSTIRNKLRYSLTGFTLIELLVVVAIIGVLASVVLASLSDARASARDAKRAGDMKQLQTALELYYNEHGQYPAHPDGICGTCIEGAATGNWGDMLDYLSPLPVDPTLSGNTNGYRYITSNVNGRRSYTMLVRLEKNNSSWCHIGMSPGRTNWVNNYPSCEF